MKNLKFGFLISLGFFLSPGQAFADHIPQSLIDGVFYEMENTYCKQDPECDYLDFGDFDEYVLCMKSILHDDYTRQRLESILSFINTHGYLPADEKEEYDFFSEMVFWVGC